MHFADPLKNLLQMGMREGSRIADLGTGSGHYALSAAHVVGADGRVYAVDIQQDVLKRLAGEAKLRKLTNLETIWGDIESGIPFHDDSLDAAILSNTLFQLGNKEKALKDVKRMLKKGGKFLVIDWAGAYGGMGPHADHVVPEHIAEQMLIEHGFHKAKAFRAGPHHYALLFTAP